MSEPKVIEVRMSEFSGNHYQEIEVYSDGEKIGDFADVPYEQTDACAALRMLTALDKLGIINLTVDNACYEEWVGILIP